MPHHHILIQMHRNISHIKQIIICYSHKKSAPLGSVGADLFALFICLFYSYVFLPSHQYIWNLFFSLTHTLSHSLSLSLSLLHSLSLSLTHSLSLSHCARQVHSSRKDNFMIFLRQSLTEWTVSVCGFSVWSAYQGWTMQKINRKTCQLIFRFSYQPTNKQCFLWFYSLFLETIFLRCSVKE